MTLPARKHPRLKNYDYSSEGCYYVTIHTLRNQPVLSRIVPDGVEARVIPTAIGQEALRQLFLLKERYPYVNIEHYALMPTHMHLLLRFEAAGASPRPTLSDIICTYKSITTRNCNHMQHSAGNRLFQNSFFERVIRSEAGFLKAWEYIEGNPGRWLEAARQNHQRG